MTNKKLKGFSYNQIHYKMIRIFTGHIESNVYAILGTVSKAENLPNSIYENYQARYNSGEFQDTNPSK